MEWSFPNFYLLVVPGAFCKPVSLLCRPDVSVEVQWSCLSIHLLIKMFEHQHNALDNCAAACVCSTWCIAVNSSHISSLHLHAICPSFNRHWRSFFSSRLSIGHLKLTSDLELMFPEDLQLVYDQITEDIQANGCCLESIPLKTEVLDADVDFGAVLHLYTDPHPDLKHLVVHSVCSLSQTAVPNLMQLTQLTKLEIREDKEEMGVLNLCRGLRNIPASLRHLVTHGHTGGPALGVHCMKPLMPPLKLLTHLEISDCRLTFANSSITCLHGLSSLKLSGDTIRADWFNLTALTNLTALDLSHTTCCALDSPTHWEMGGPLQEITDPLLTFTAWSKLSVLNVISCSLYDDQTILNVPLVQEVLLSWLPVSTTGTQICCHLETYDLDAFLELSVDVYAADHLVNLNLMLDDDVCSAYQLNSGLCQLLHSCQLLQVLCISVELEDAVSILVDAEHGSSLTDLRLEKMSFNVLDLRQTSSLTSIQLINLTPCRQGRQNPELFLPGDLLSLHVVGGVIFYPGDVPPLELCNCLTSLVIGIDSVVLRVPGKLSLPSSLRHLEVHALEGDEAGWTEFFDWRCLDGCSHLESMLVPNKAFLSEHAGAVQLHAWLKSARHLHVLACAAQ